MPLSRGCGVELVPVLEREQRAGAAAVPELETEERGTAAAALASRLHGEDRKAAATTLASQLLRAGPFLAAARWPWLCLVLACGGADLRLAPRRRRTTWISL
mmetsp:Transcript_113497/g.362125  ORF Transcript_113497/g.362125 Transcript_113497/m.362125 type:complete len:102 (+) Transcript_113497:640-945(+)